MAWKSHHEEEERKVGFIFEEMMREKVGFIENTARGHRWGGDLSLCVPGRKKNLPVREGARREGCENEKEGGRGGGAPAGAAVRQRAP